MAVERKGAVAVVSILAVALFILFMVVSGLREGTRSGAGEDAQAAASRRFRAELETMTRDLRSQGESSLLPQVFMMLNGQSRFDPAVIAAARPRVAALTRKIEDYSARLQRAKGELASQRPDGVKSRRNADLLEKTGLAFDINRRYFADAGRLLDFLADKSGSYRAGPGGPRFRSQADADTCNALLQRIVGEQKELADLARSLLTKGPQ